MRAADFGVSLASERRLVTLWSDPQPTPVRFQLRQWYQL
jgi:hypothetical protein